MSKRFILIGHPVGHSVSPAIHHAAYTQLGIDAQYDLVDCPDVAAVQAQVALIRSGEISGANVTVPWKRVAFDAADEVDESAARVGVANVLARSREGHIKAYNTDAIGLADELRRATHAAKVDVAARNSALVIGNGGATRAAVVACQMNGIERVAVTARSFTAQQSKESWPHGQAFVDLGAELLTWPSSDGGAAVSKFLQRAHLIIQATSAGMKGAEDGETLAKLLPWGAFAPGLAYDLVYNPPKTPFLNAAEALGHRAEGGLGMLVGQAAHAIRIWTGTLPDPAPLLLAAQKRLGL